MANSRSKCEKELKTFTITRLTSSRLHGTLVVQDRLKLIRDCSTGHGTTDWFQIRKGVRQGYILSPCLFNLMCRVHLEKPGLDEAQAESRLLGEISITTDMQMTPPLWQKVKKN